MSPKSLDAPSQISLDVKIAYGKGSGVRCKLFGEASGSGRSFFLHFGAQVRTTSKSNVSWKQSCF